MRVIPRHVKYLYSVNILVGACWALSDVLAAMEWVQTYPSFVKCLSTLPIYTPNKGVTVTSADMDTHSYNSYLEFGLRVFNCYS